MKLRDLTITQLPGFGERLSVSGFDPGFTLVTGPNASGKSSLVRALRHLVAPDSAAARGPLTLEARFQAGDDLYTVARSGEQVTWQRNGQPVDAPELPPGDFLRCYWLSMADLLHAGDTETAIVSRLQRELAGGFDLDGLQSDRLFDIKARQGQNEAKRLREKQQRLTQCQRDYAQLDQQRHHLAELDQRIEDARAARAGEQRTRQALDWLAVRQRRLHAQAHLEQFPETMQRLQGHELERLQELEAKRASLARDIDATRHRQEEARHKHQQAALGETVPASAQIEACREHLEEADRLDAERQGVLERLDEAKIRAANATSALNPPEGRLPEITPQAVNEAGSVADSLRRAQLRLDELEARLERVAQPEGDPDELRAQINELRRWLRQLEPARRRGLLAGSGVALVAAGAAAVVGLLYGLPMSWVPALIALAAAGWSAQQCVSLITTAREARRRAEEAGVEVDAWEPEPISQRLRQLETEMVQLEHQRVAAQQATPLGDEIERLREERSQLEGNKQAVAEAVGFDPSLIGESAARFLKLASDLDEARGERDRLQQRLDHLGERLEKELESVRDLLARHGLLPDDTSVKGVRAAFNDLHRRSETVNEAKAELERLNSQLERFQADDREQQETIAALYKRLGLEEGDRHRLEQLLGQLEDYRNLTATLEAERLAESTQSAGLEADPDLVGLVEAGDRAGLEQRLSALQAQAAHYDELVEERSALDNRLAQAGHDRTLEQARFERDQARAALEDVYDATMLAEAGQFLLAEVDEAHRSEREPSVLADARQSFARFTHHRYQLRMDHSGRLAVRDQLQEQDRQLAELSTGTHMQLLMALRLAWVREQEKGSEPLPIFLDEVLTTSDPERFRAVAASLQVLVEEGRQIIYLSAEPADRGRWEEVMGTAITHMDLQALRQGSEPTEPKAYPVFEPLSLPTPEGLDPETWASRVGVPPIRPGQGAGSIGVFHLLRDDLNLAHHLMQDWLVDALGRLESLLAEPAGPRAVKDESLRGQLNSRCQVARVWVAVWQRGRGRPVDRNVLEASGAVTPKFIDAVAELAGQVDHDAQSLIAGLDNGEVARFQKPKIRELEAYLENEGYLDPQPPLEASERERAVLLGAGHLAEPDAIRQWVAWLEAGLDPALPG